MKNSGNYRSLTPFGMTGSAKPDATLGFGMDLDDEYPTGDGTADTETTVQCPYCAETCTIALDPGSGATQEYVEDCPVCCQPWTVTVTYDASGTASVSVDAV
jgi:Cysteine-rich CPXCG